MRIRRFTDNPIIHASLSDTVGANINGPSLIRVPEWVETPLGRYYLYFADHKGQTIRLAYADRLQGPWRIHAPGALRLADTPFLQHPPEAPGGVDVEQLSRPRAAGVPSVLNDATLPHIASPEVQVVPELRQIRLYYHGLDGFARQVTRVALSTDGLRFEARSDVVGRPYFRAFRHAGAFYGMAMPGVFYRSGDGLSDFEEGPTLFPAEMRHGALLVRDGELWVFWTRVGDAPERILLSRIDIAGDWMGWRLLDTREVLRPETDWEGADLPATPSMRSAALTRVNQLRDPAIYVEGEHVYLLYSVAGESGIAIAEIEIGA